MRRCTVQEENWLTKLYGTEFPHNSAHYQAVDRLEEGLVTDSRCLEDGTVEAIHHQTLPIYGAQWHPKRMRLEWERDDTVNGFPVMQYLCRLCGGDPDAFTECMQSEIMGDMMGL